MQSNACFVLCALCRLCRNRNGKEMRLIFLPPLPPKNKDYVLSTIGIESCWGNRREGDHGGDLGVDGWIILGWISRRWAVGVWTGLGWPRIETVGGPLCVR